MNWRENIRVPGLWLVWGLYAVLTFVAVLHHQPWRDEAQSWLIVRDLGLWDLIRQMPYEGTPPLWHLLVLPLAKAGLPYAAQNWLHYLLAQAAVFLLLFGTRLPRSVKFLLPFGYYFLFEYSVVARNYVLTALLLFAISSFYSQRFQRPLIFGTGVALLAWTNMHTWAAALALAMLFVLGFIRARVWTWRLGGACALMALGILSASTIFLPYPGRVLLGVKPYGGLAVAAAVASSIWPDIALNTRAWVWLAAVWIPPILFLLHTWPARFFLSLTWGWLGILFWFKDAYPRHHGLLLIYFLFAWCLDLELKEDATGTSRFRRLATGVFFLLVLLNVASAFQFYLHHRGRFFSGGTEMAAFIQHTGLARQDLAALSADLGKVVLPYFPDKRFYRMEEGEMGTYNTWSQAYFDGASAPFPALYARMIDHYLTQPHRPESVLFLCSQHVIEALPRLRAYLDYSSWALLFHNTRPCIKSEEFFYLFRIPLPPPAEYYQHLFEAQPDAISRLNNAAWLLATAGPDGPSHAHLPGWPEAAVIWAERALELSTGNVADVWDTLAAARANVGDYQGAVAAAEQASTLALTSGNRTLALQIQARLDKYRAGIPWRE